MIKIGYAKEVNKLNNIFTFIERNVANSPDKPVFIWTSKKEAAIKAEKGDLSSLPHKTMSYGDLKSKVERVATGYKNLGITKGDRAIIYTPVEPSMYIAMFALQLIGAVPVFLDAWTDLKQMGACAEVTSPKALISPEALFLNIKKIPSLSNIPLKICIGDADQKYDAHFDELIKTEGNVEIAAMEREDTGLITFTTGSTGTPKGANRTHRFLAAQHYSINSALPYEDDDIDYPIFPIFMLNNIARGITSVLPAVDLVHPSRFDSDIILSQVSQCKVTCMTLNPYLLDALSNLCISKNISLPHVRRTAAGGAPISKDAIHRYKNAAPDSKLLIMYGSTEAEPIADIDADEVLKVGKSRQSVDFGVSVGHFVEGLKYKFIKIDKKTIKLDPKVGWRDIESKPNEVGEILVAGEHVCNEYYNNKEAFDRAKIVDLDGTIWHRTADLGRLDTNGSLWLVGRIHSAILRNGEYLFPIQAEIIMKRFDFIHLAAYLGVDDQSLGQKAVVVITPKDSDQLGDTNIHDKWESMIRDEMSKHSLPVDQFIVRKTIEIDRRHRSKVEYAKLRKELVDEGIV